jgi:hypothetical protein
LRDTRLSTCSFHVATAVKTAMRMRIAAGAGMGTVERAHLGILELVGLGLAFLGDQARLPGRGEE